MAENSSDTEDQQDHRGQQQSRSTGRQPAPKAAAKSPAKPTPKPAPKPASTSAKAAPRSDQPSRARSGSGGDGSSTSASGGPDGQDGQGGQRSSDAHEHHHHGDGSRPRLNGRRAARLAALELAELTGKEFEGVVGIRKVDDEWHVEIEVLEMERIPSTTDVLAVYEVSLDASGELVGYERTARYVRGDAGEDRR